VLMFFVAGLLMSHWLAIINLRQCGPEAPRAKI